MKKILGIFFLVVVVLALVGQATNGTLFDTGSVSSSCSSPLQTSAAAGALFGQVLMCALLIGSSVFFFVLDKSSSMPIVKGLKCRQKLAPFSIIFLVIYLIMFAGTYLSATSTAPIDFYLYGSYADVALYAFRGSWPLFVGFAIFGLSFSFWFFPIMAYSSVLKSTKTNLETYVNDEFVQIGDSGKIFASQHALLIKSHMLLIPLDIIKETSLKEVKIGSFVLEANVIIFFTNDKKITISSKNYDEIKSVVRK